MMDVEAGNLQFVGITISLLKHSIQNLKTFYQITPTLIIRLSFAIVAYSVFDHPILMFIQSITADPDNQQAYQQSIFLIIFQLIYLVFFFFIVASIYPYKHCIYHVSERLFITFILLALLMLVYYTAYLIVFVSMIVAFDRVFLLFVPLALAYLFLFVVHVYITALWRLASVVVVLEPDVYMFAALKKSYELLKGNMLIAGLLEVGYSSICGLISLVFGAVFFRGDSTSIFTRVVVGGFLVGVLLIVNWGSLLVQTVFYYYLCN